MEEIELNLDNPIFVYYVCINGRSRMASEELLASATNYMSRYKNITIWIVATDGDSKIECIYNGIDKNMNKRIKLFNDCETLEDFQREIRQWRLDNLLD